MVKYCVEIVRNDELVDNSAVYFETEKELIEYCNDRNFALEENEVFYVTKGEESTPCDELSNKVNDFERL